jgi:hypothetical protein
MANEVGALKYMEISAIMGEGVIYLFNEAIRLAAGVEIPAKYIPPPFFPSSPSLILV